LLRLFNPLALFGLLVVVASPFSSDAQSQELAPVTIQDMRAYDASHHGFKWMPWLSVPQSMHDYIKKRDPRLYQRITNVEKNVDVATRDIDLDKKMDTIIHIYDLNFCGSLGCTFFVVPGESRKKVFEFGAHGVKPVRRGIDADGTVYKF
jgi:hypothetical protein